MLDWLTLPFLLYRNKHPLLLPPLLLLVHVNPLRTRTSWHAFHQLCLSVQTAVSQHSKNDSASHSSRATPHRLGSTHGRGQRTWNEAFKKRVGDKDEALRCSYHRIFPLGLSRSPQQIKRPQDYVKRKLCQCNVFLWGQTPYVTS